ncbi:MAG TPA: hypothetical protein VEK07_20350 [Polyangiaceae bacterium]|nr:hypothetical protein [Polyangiaceae bacterium]
MPKPRFLFLMASPLFYACTSSTATPPPGAGDGGATTNTASSGGSGSSATGSAASTSAGGSSGSGVGSGDGGGTHGSTDGGGADGAGAPGCSGLAFCDNFDNPATDIVDGGPTPGLWTVEGEQGCSGQGPITNPITIDNTQSHSPPNSAKIVGSASNSCGPAMISSSAFASIPSGSDVYGRFYIFLSSTSATFDHTAIMMLNFSGNNDGGIDFGNQATFLSLNSEGAGNATNVLMWQTQDSSGTLPDKDTAGGAQSAYPTANTWTCVEFHTSASTHSIETWVGGAQAPVPGLTFPPPVAMVNDQWEGGLSTQVAFNFDSLGFGWVSYSGVAMNLWIDDVALSTTGRIGCN